MEWQPLLTVPGPLLSSPHISWPTSSGGGRIIMLCVLTNRCEWRSCGHESEGQTSGTTLSPADGSSGSGENQPTMDGTRGALLPLAAGSRLSATQARVGGMSWDEEDGECARRSTRMQ